MQEKDIPDVVRMHSEYIPGALFPKLGETFMQALYSSILQMDCAANFVWEQDGKTAGFITATTDASFLMRNIMIKNFPLFLWRTFVYLLGNPLRIIEVWETLTYSKMADIPGTKGELLFIALDKDVRQKNVSDDLVIRCIRWLQEKGHGSVKVTTYTTNRGANALLERLGFVIAKTLPFRNKEINLYVYEIKKK